MKAATDTGPPGQKRRTQREAGPSEVTAGKRMTRRTIDVRDRLVKRIELLCRRFWQGDVTARASIIKILQEALQ